MNNDNGKGAIQLLTAQALEGKQLVAGEGLKKVRHHEEPLRVIGGIPVYHNSTNVFEAGADPNNRKRWRRWGYCYHPGLLMGMPSVGALLKLYTDTQFAGWYLLWALVKIDEWALGPNDWEPWLLAWTPRSSWDSRSKAGYRLFTAHMQNELLIEPPALYSEYDKPGWVSEWSYSDNCFDVMASLQKTAYPNQKALEQVLKRAPGHLKEHILANAITDATMRQTLR